MVFIYCVIGVLGMVPTGGSGCCSRMLKGERSVGYVKYKRRPREVRFLRRPPRCRSQRHLSFLGVSSSFDCRRLTNATLGRLALHCIKMCGICQLNIIRTRFSKLEKGSDYLFISRDMSRPISPMGYPFVRNPSLEVHAKRKPYKQKEQPSSAAPFSCSAIHRANSACTSALAKSALISSITQRANRSIRCCG